MSGFEIKFDIESLNSKLNSLKKEETKYRSSYGGEEEGSRTPIAFLPEGSHKMRMFLDPNGELIRDVRYHKYNNYKFVCPDSYFYGKKEEGVKCKFCEVHAQMGSNWRHPAARRLINICYAYIASTDKEGEYFKPGKSYAVITNGKKFRDTFIGWVSSLAGTQAQDFIVPYLNPNAPSSITQVDIVKGTQGRVNIGVFPGPPLPAIDLGDWYKPLGEVYVPEGFDEISYNEAMKKLKEDYLDENGDLRKEFVEAAEAEAEALAKEAGTATENSASPAEIIVPDFVTDPEKRKCFSHYTPTDPRCITCEYSEHCMAVTV